MMSLYNTSNGSIISTVKLFARRTLVPEEKDNLWRIEKGFVRTYSYLEDGTTITLGVWGKGDIVGKGLSKLELYQIECLTSVKATIIPLQGYDKLTEVLFAHIAQAEELALIRGYKKVEMMLVKLLLWLSKKFGSQVEEGRLIDMYLTHEDLASLLGSTRVTVTRVLGDLEQQGLINRLSLHRIVLKQDEIWYYEI
jgi:CRP-like cAMP-binding protein